MTTLKRLTSLIIVFTLLGISTFIEKGEIHPVYASPDIHQGNLILSGNNVTTIEGQFDINGSIIVEENATLILKNAVINFTQKEWKQFNITLRNPTNGNPRLLVSYATIISTLDIQFEMYFYGNSTAQISHLFVHNKIIAYETSWLNITDSLHIWYIDLRDSSSANISNSEFWYVKPHDTASVFMKDSEIIMAMENYGTSTSSVSNTTIGFLGTYTSSITALSNCNISNMRPQGGQLSSLTAFDCNIDNFDVSTSCPIYMSNCTASSFEAGGKSNVTLSDCSVNGMYIHSSSFVTVLNELTTNGSIIVEENATLTLADALLNFTQTENWQFELTLDNPANGNPKLHISNTIVTSTYSYSIKLHQNSSGVINDTQLTAAIGHYCWLWTYDSVTSSLQNLTVHGLSSSSSSGISLLDSTVVILNIYESCDASAHNSTIKTANSYGTATIYISECTLNNVQTFDQSVVSIFDSTVYSLYSQNVTTIWLENSTYVDYIVFNESKIFICWYLDVQVEDSISQAVPSATVTASYPNGTQADSDLTDGYGWTRLTLIEKMINMTGEFSIENYTVEASYDIYQDQTTVNMTENKEVLLQLSFVIPEFPSLTILSLLMIVMLLVMIVYRRHRRVTLKLSS